MERRGIYTVKTYHLPLCEGTPPILGGEFKVSRSYIGLTLNSAKTKNLEQFTGIAYGRISGGTFTHVHYRKKNRGILAIFPPNPQAKQKERSHERLGFFRK